MFTFESLTYPYIMKDNTTTAPRGKSEWTTPTELRALLKSELGLNAKQVTVSKRGSIEYLTLTVRDPLVDLLAVTEWAAQFNTWTMDETDYCEGQSLHVETTKEVDRAHAAPWMATVEALLPDLDSTEVEGCLALDAIRPGLVIWRDRCDFRVDFKRERSCYRPRTAVLARESWVIEALALDIARLLAGASELPELPFTMAATPAPEPERPAYQDKPRTLTKQSLFATEGLFQLR